MEWEQRKLLLICPLCFNFYYDTSSPSPTLGHVHIHQKHRKTVIGVQLGNIHQRQKTKEGSKTIHPFLLFKWDVWFGKKTKGDKKKSFTSPRIDWHSAIICLVLFLRLESSRPVICVSPGLSEGFSEPFTVLISAFSLFLFSIFWISHCAWVDISRLFFYICFSWFHDHCDLWCFLGALSSSPLFFVPYCRNMWSWFSGLQACTNWRCANKQFLDTSVIIQ